MDFSRQPKDVEKFKELINSFTKSIEYDQPNKGYVVDKIEPANEDQFVNQNHKKVAQVERISAPSRPHRSNDKVVSDNELEF